jgi:serine/threonine-protein kinase
MGTVYLAADPNLPRQTALKVLSAELSRDRDFRARFIREADMAAALEHPQIVSVFSRGQTEDGQLWIAMQFVDGIDADAALYVGTMTPHRAVHIITQVARALDFAHARNVVHRDIKPGNFLLSGPVGPDERVLLGDFGIARAFDDVGLTATGSVLATVAYAAPEVLSNAPIDGRVDIYSLGCALFRLLTGMTPFPATNGAAAVMSAHLFSPPPRVTDAVPSLPAALDHVIAVAMAKNPAARFGSASALAEAAARALHDPKFRGPLPPIPSREVGPHKVQSPAAAPWWEHSGQRTAARGVGPQQAKRRRRGAIGAALAAIVLVAATVTVAAWPDDTTSGPADATKGGSATGSTSGPSGGQGPPATDIAGPQLRPILLTAAEIASASNGDVVALENDSPTLLDDAATVDNRQCVGAWTPAQQSVYGATDYTGVAAQLLRALNQAAWQDSVTQAVIAYPSQESAGKSYVTQRGQWALCGGKTLTVTTAGQPTQTWDFAQPATTSGVLTLVATLRGGAASCQRGMLVRGNVIIDIRQCRPGSNTNVTALVTATAGKVPHQ